VVGSPDQNTVFTRTIDAAHLLRVGVNTVAVEVHQSNDASSDLYFDFALVLPGDPTSAFAELTVTSDLTVKARAYDGNEWSALSENVLTLPRPPMDYAALRVSELMYAPPAPEEGSAYVDDDFAWMELCNMGTTPLDLEGVNFVDGITHTFAPFLLGPGSRLLLAKDPTAVATRQAIDHINVVAWTGGNLARSGETLSLAAPGGDNILTFTYSSLWYPETHNTGLSLVALDLAAAEPLWSTADNWQPGRVLFGTPGLPEAPALANPRLTTDGLLLVDSAGTAGGVELWFSDDFESWTPCDAGAWSQTDGVLTIDLNHSTLSAKPRAFFHLRQPE
jgi:hypothetical protein